MFTIYPTETIKFDNFKEWYEYVSNNMQRAAETQNVHIVLIKNDKGNTIAVWDNRADKGQVNESRNPHRLENERLMAKYRGKGKRDGS